MASSTSVVLTPPPKTSDSDDDDEEYESEYEEIEEEIEVEEESDVEEGIEEEIDVEEEIEEEVDVGAEDVETVGEDKVRVGQTVARQENLKIAPKHSTSDVGDEEYESEYEEIEVEEEIEVDDENDEEVDVGAEHIETEGEDVGADLTVARLENLKNALKPSNSDVDDEEYDTDSEEIEVEEMEEEEVDVGAEHIETGGEDEVRADITVARQENLKNAPKPSTSDFDDGEYYETDSEEIEEEIEVVKGMEVEEQVYVGAEHIEIGVKDEVRDDLPVARQENLKNDTGEMVKHDAHKDYMQSSSLAQEVFVSFKNNSDVKTPKSSDKEELHVDGEGISKNNNRKTLLSDSGEVNHAKTIPYTGVVYSTSILANTFEDKVNSIEPITEETNQSSVDVGNTSPRLHTTQIRLRDPLATAGFDRESKKLRIVCEFHSKGWCINGNSCRFLHIMGGSDAVMKKNKTCGREGVDFSHS